MARMHQRRKSRGLLCALVLLAGCADEPEAPALAHPNVFLLVVDDIAADEVGRTQARFPALETLAAQGARFHSSVLASTDLTANLVTLLTSIPPAQHRVIGQSAALAEEAKTLAEVFAHRGFATAAFTDAALEADARGLLQGFEKRGKVENAGEAIAGAAAWLDRWSESAPLRPFFLYLHVATGSAGQAASDPRIREALALVNDLPGPNETIVALTGTRSPNLDPARPPSERALSVPLMVRFPSRLADGVVHEHRARTMDVGPTLLMLAAVRRPEDYGFDHPAFSLAMHDLVEILVGVPRGVAMTRAGEGRLGDDILLWLRLRDHRLMRRIAPDGTVSHALFDVTKDPDEETDLSAQESQRTSVYVQKLDAWQALCAERPSLVKR